MRVGLTGGIGAGKSAVAGAFERLGAFVIDTDVLARQAVAPGSEGLALIARAWPQIASDGSLDRAGLAAIVFGDAAQRERLNAILHPQIRRLAAQRETEAMPGQLVVHVVPLLFETGYAKNVEASVLVVAPESLRVARIVERDGVDAPTARARMDAQIDPDRARALADYVIVNDGDRTTLEARTRAVYQELAS